MDVQPKRDGIVIRLLLIALLGFGLLVGTLLSSSEPSALSFEASDRAVFAGPSAYEPPLEKPDSAVAVPIVAGAWTPRLNGAKPQENAPSGMAWVPGGQFWMGTDDPNIPDAHPWHRVYVDGFWMDRDLVTNAQFTAFVNATHYLTLAEVPQRREDFSGPTEETLTPGSMVFASTAHPVVLIEPTDKPTRWKYVRGADWRHPEGPGSSISDRMSHPVVQVGYADAAAFCAWSDRRLPTEAEFEFASRGGLDRKKYDWGDLLMPDGKERANLFQRHFTDQRIAQGYVGTSPIESFPANGYGLFDMSGNVWEWVSDWYWPDYYQVLAAGGDVAVNPRGPHESFNPDEPGAAKRVLRGGSYLCGEYCSAYTTGLRSKRETSLGANDLGFRCARDARSSLFKRTSRKHRPNRHS